MFHYLRKIGIALAIPIDIVKRYEVRILTVLFNHEHRIFSAEGIDGPAGAGRVSDPRAVNDKLVFISPCRNRSLSLPHTVSVFLGCQAIRFPTVKISGHAYPIGLRSSYLKLYLFRDNSFSNNTPPPFRDLFYKQSVSLSS